MSELTPRFGLPLLLAGQAQKEMSHNEALVQIDLGLHAAAVSIGENAPPAAPSPGECHIVGDAPSGAWTGRAHALAGWTDGGWRFLAPREGMRLWLSEEEQFALFRGGDWHVGEAHGKVFVEGEQVVGARADAIAEPFGGEVVDAEARAAIVAVLEALRSHGLVESD